MTVSEQQVTEVNQGVTIISAEKAVDKKGVALGYNSGNYVLVDNVVQHDNTTSVMLRPEPTSGPGKWKSPLSLEDSGICSNGALLIEATGKAVIHWRAISPSHKS